MKSDFARIYGLVEAMLAGGDEDAPYFALAEVHDPEFMRQFSADVLDADPTLVVFLDAELVSQPHWNAIEACSRCAEIDMHGWLDLRAETMDEVILKLRPLCDIYHVAGRALGLKGFETRVLSEDFQQALLSRYPAEYLSEIGKSVAGR